MGIASGFFDVSGVEVLRGPQATFIGQAAAGGAILINSARPNFDGVNGYAELTVGDYNRRKINAAVNLPITDTFGARLAYMSENRASFFSNDAGVTTGNAGAQHQPGDQEDDNFRLSLLWEPNENFSLWAKLEQSHLDQHGPTEQPNHRPYTGYWDDDGDVSTPRVAVTSYAPHYNGPDATTATPDGNGGFLPGLNNAPGPNGAVYYNNDPWVLSNPLDQRRETKVDRVSVEANYTFDSGLTFRSLSSNIVMNRLQDENGNSLVYESNRGWQLGPGMQTWSQEFNLISPEGQRLEWLVGAYRNNRHTELSFNSPSNRPGSGDPGDVLSCGWQYDSSWTPCPTSFVPGIARSFWTSHDDVRHTALFGQLNFDLTDTIELTLETRLNEDHNRQKRAPGMVATSLVPTAAAPVRCEGIVEAQIFYCPQPGRPDIDNPATLLAWDGDITTYKAGLNWEPAEGHFIYAFFAKGYKSGQTGVLSTTNAVQEEIVNDLEIGWKGTLRPGLYAEFGIYSMDYEDMQLSTFSRGPIESRNGTTNIGDSTIEGFEGSLRAVFGGFGINASFAYTQSELGLISDVDTRALAGLNDGASYPGDINLGCDPQNPGNPAVGCFDYSSFVTSFQGSQNPFSPELTYNLGIDYAFQLSNGGTITPSLSLNHADSTYTNIDQRGDNDYYRTDARDIVNFSLTYQRDEWDYQFFVNNATDEVFIEGVSNGGDGIFYGDPRTVGFRARMQF
jgi:iron complex outermembrane receptor protein